VDLELKARWQPVFEHPLDDLAWFEVPEDRTEKDRPDALRKLVTFESLRTTRNPPAIR
jgi:hypothetical protein